MPALLAEALNVALPEYAQAEIASVDFNQSTPTEYRADSVVVLKRDQRPKLAVVTEVRLGRDKDKRWSWPVYVTALRARVQCPAMLLVLCPDRSMVQWCARPIDLGHPGFTLTPLVIGPDVIPCITDPRRVAELPELAVMSAVVHGADPEGPQVLKALLTVLMDARIVDQKRATLYSDIVYAALPEAARKEMKALMSVDTYHYQSDLAKRIAADGKLEGKAEGRAEGRREAKAEAVVDVLEARGLRVGAEVRERVMGCEDVATLDVWLRRAMTVAEAKDLFENL